jgi:hypothetical protein
MDEAFGYKGLKVFQLAAAGHAAAAYLAAGPAATTISDDDVYLHLGGRNPQTA